MAAFVFLDFAIAPGDAVIIFPRQSIPYQGKCSGFSLIVFAIMYAVRPGAKKATIPIARPASLPPIGTLSPYIFMIAFSLSVNAVMTMFSAMSLVLGV